MLSDSHGQCVFVIFEVVSRESEFGKDYDIYLVFLWISLKRGLDSFDGFGLVFVDGVDLTEQSFNIATRSLWVWRLHCRKYKIIWGEKEFHFRSWIDCELSEGRYEIKKRMCLLCYNSMKILGVGVDLVSNSKIRGFMHQSYANRFLKKFLHQREM